MIQQMRAIGILYLQKSVSARTGSSLVADDEATSSFPP